MARLGIKSNGVVKKERKKSYIEEQATRNKTPAPVAYSNTKHIVWNNKNISGKVVTKFTKTKRVSMTEEIMLKKSEIPGPNKYMKNPAYFKNLKGKTHGTYMQEPKRMSLFEEAEITSKTIPASNKYEPPAMEKMRPRSAKTIFYPRVKPKYTDKDLSKIKNTRIAPIVKNDEPSSVTYKTEHSKDILQQPNPLI